MYTCDYCKIVSPSEDLAITHIRHKHKSEINNNKSWSECVWCFLFYPVGKKHLCLRENQCPLCSENLKSATNKTLYNHYRTKHQENIKVSPKTIYREFSPYANFITANLLLRFFKTITKNMPNAIFMHYNFF